MQEKTTDTPPARKPYSSPVLETYGNIHEITRQVGNMGNSNDGGGGKTKTA